MRRHAWVFAVALLVGMVGTVGSASAATKPKIDRAATLRFASALAPTTWDPMTNKNQGATQLYFTLAYDRLLGLDDSSGTLTVVPQLAASYSYSSDRLTLNMPLRKDVKFQDGTPFNASAVKANIERAKTVAGSTSAPLLASISTVEVVNDFEVKIHLSKLDSGLLYNLANVAGAMISPAAFNTNLERTPVGSGPYKLTNSTSTEADFDRWDGYWDKTRALAAKVVASGIPDVTARLNLWKSGQLDIAQASPTQYAEVDALAKANKAKFQLACSYPSYIVLLNTAHKPFDNLDVRKAINLAIDRKTMAETLLPYNKPLQQVIPPGFPGHIAALDKNIPFNVNQAKSLMTKAGASNVSMNLITPATDPYPDLATVVQRQLSAIGINATIQQVTPATSYSEWLKGTADGFVTSFAGAVDMTTQINNYINTYNFGGATALPAGLLDKYNAAKDLAAGSKEQTAAFRDINRMLVDSPVHAPLINYCNGYAIQTNVVNTEHFAPSGNISWTNLSIPGIVKGKK
jgi:peptide/nickel transport system substrate-binding protein